MKYFKMNRINVIIVLFFYLFVFFIIAGCGEKQSKKISFSQTDADGYWEMIGFGDTFHQRVFNQQGFLILNNSGDVITGEITDFGVDSKIFTGGAVSITSRGSATGSIESFLDDTNEYLNYTVHDGQMTFNKDVIVYAGDFPVSNKGVGILVKRSGTFTGFDLEGDWVFPLEGVFTVSVDHSGAVTGCSILSDKGTSGICSGTLSITSEGVVSGQIKAVNGRAYQIKFNGRMDSGKNIMSFAGGLQGRFEGLATFAVKRDGTFSLSDGRGNWKIFVTDTQDTVYGTIMLEDSGKISGGNWSTVRKGSGTFTGGTLLISQQGDVSGLINTSAGNTYTIIGGQASSAGDFIGGLLKDSSGIYRVMVLVKFPG